MKILRPFNHPAIVEGPVLYYPPSRCHCIIRLKSKLIKALPDIKTAKKVRCRAELWRTYEDLNKRVREINKKNEGIPLLVFLYFEK